MKIIHDYSDLDAALIEKIKLGKTTFTMLVSKFSDKALPFCVPSLGRQPEPDRVIDRRLQALRKKKLISFSPKTGWSFSTD